MTIRPLLLSAWSEEHTRGRMLRNDRAEGVGPSMKAHAEQLRMRHSASGRRMLLAFGFVMLLCCSASLSLVLNFVLRSVRIRRFVGARERWRAHIHYIATCCSHVSFRFRRRPAAWSHNLFRCLPLCRSFAHLFLNDGGNRDQQLLRDGGGRSGSSGRDSAARPAPCRRCRRR